ncbi:hypothetical protein Tco_0315125, partial [Tanacetum coccineum]
MQRMRSRQRIEEQLDHEPDTDVDELVAQKDQFQPDVKSVGSSSHTVESANNVDGEYRKHTEKERKWFYLGDFGRDDI